jgi:DnaJ-class molecular chaperone
MTNLYEHLGVIQTATIDEIKDAFEKQSSFFDPERNPQAEDLAYRKTVFADILLAYNTLSKEETRKEYDDYISQSRFSANFAGANDDEDPDLKAERERRKAERGKRRYEEDYSFINNEFFSAWQNRTGNFTGNNSEEN